MSRIGLLMRKIGCTSIFDSESYSYKAATLLQLEESAILSTVDDSEGVVVRVGYGSVPVNKLNKAQREIYAKANVQPKRKMLQFRVPGTSSLSVNQSLSVEHFAVGQYVDAMAQSIGKGLSLIHI